MAAWALIPLLLAAAPGDDLARELDRSGIARAGLSVLVGEAGGPTLLSVAAGEPRVPASNQKLLTAAAALTLLGRDFHFETRLFLGPNKELVVRGDGDPNLSGRWFEGDPTRVLRAIARDVARKGVRALPGGLVLDAGRFDDTYVHPDWPADQLDRWYCAPVAALVYNDSCWDVTVRPGARVGQRARVEVQPALLHPRILNRCSTVAARRDHLVHVGRAAAAELEVRGHILLTSAGITGTVAVRDPVAFFGDALLAALRAEGIHVDGGVRRGPVPKRTQPILVYRSDLARTLRVMLTNSQNLYAECTFKRLGKGSFEAGAQAVREALRRLGVDARGVVVRDGSGLARTNRVTARALYGVLQALRDEPLFVESLAAGGEGTLRRYFAKLGTRVRAKTGYIRGVKALSGYVTGRSGGRYVFVVLANGTSVARARDFQLRLVRRLAEAP